MTFDDELRRATRRREPPAGFVGRTLGLVARDAHDTRAARPGDGLQRRPFRHWMMAGVAASLMATVGIVATRTIVHQQSVREAERTRYEVEVGLRIASGALDNVRLRIAAITHHEGATDGTPPQ